MEVRLALTQAGRAVDGAPVAVRPARAGAGRGAARAPPRGRGAPTRPSCSSPTPGRRPCWRSDTAGPAARRAVGARRITGTTLASLAAGNVVSEAAVRSAGRVVRFGTGRLAHTKSARWVSRGPSCRRRCASRRSPRRWRRPPACRPGWSDRRSRPSWSGCCRWPRLRQVVLLRRRPAARLRRRGARRHHGDRQPALADEPVAISGAIWRACGGQVIEPYAVRTGDRVKVPDLAATGAVPPAADRPSTRPLATALEDALALLARSGPTAA